MFVFTSILYIVLFMVSVLGMLFVSVLFVKILRKNPEEFAEARRLQGHPKNVIKGKLARHPDSSGDFRVITGLRFDKKTDTYTSQSALSSEGLKVVFPD